MKKLFKLVAACAVSVLVMVPSVQASSVCDALKQYAHATMTSRQIGVPIQHSIHMVTRKNYSPQSEQIMLTVLYKAYEYPMYDKLRDRDFIIHRFASDTHEVCQNVYKK